MDFKSTITGLIGTALSSFGVLAQAHEIIEIISLIVTILGAILTFIVMPLLNWYSNAKKDDKITLDEVKEGVETLKDGIKAVEEEIKEKNEEN